MKKPVSVSNDGTGNLVAVCDDGSVYVLLSPYQNSLLGDDKKGWREGKPIPGTRESREMRSLRKITAAWNHYWNDTCQEESDVNYFFNAVKGALEEPF